MRRRALADAPRRRGGLVVRHIIPSPPDAPPWISDRLTAIRKSSRSPSSTAWCCPRAGKLPLVFRTLTALPLSFTEFSVACRDLPDRVRERRRRRELRADGGAGAGEPAEPVRHAGRRVGRRRLPARVRAALSVLHDAGDRGRAASRPSASPASRSARSATRARRSTTTRASRCRRGRSARSCCSSTKRICCAAKRCAGRSPQLQLLEPFTMQAVPNEGTPLAMTGMYRVAEQKLAELARRQAEGARAERDAVARLRAPHLARQLRAAARPAHGQPAPKKS